VPKKPKRLNEITERFQRLHDSAPKTLEEQILESPSHFLKKQDKAATIESDPFKEQIKFVSAVDCKPVRPPYLKLMPLQEFIEL